MFASPLLEVSQTVALSYRILSLAIIRNHVNILQSTTRPHHAGWFSYLAALIWLLYLSLLACMLYAF